MIALKLLGALAWGVVRRVTIPLALAAVALYFLIGGQALYEGTAAVVGHLGQRIEEAATGARVESQTEALDEDETRYEQLVARRALVRARLESLETARADLSARLSAHRQALRTVFGLMSSGESIPVSLGETKSETPDDGPVAGLALDRDARDLLVSATRIAEQLTAHKADIQRVRAALEGVDRRIAAAGRAIVERRRDVARRRANFEARRETREIDRLLEELDIPAAQPAPGVSLIDLMP